MELDNIETKNEGTLFKNIVEVDFLEFDRL